MEHPQSLEKSNEKGNKTENKTISENQTTEHCPECQQELIGDITLEEAFLGQVNFLIFAETPDRNWILCDFCNKTICKDCCISPDSGYCDQCFYKINIKPYLP